MESEIKDVLSCTMPVDLSILSQSGTGEWTSRTDTTYNYSPDDMKSSRHFDLPRQVEPPKHIINISNISDISNESDIFNKVIDEEYQKSHR